MRFNPLKLLRPRRSRPDVEAPQIVSIFNRWSTYPSEGLTPARLTTILKEADAGDMMRFGDLMQEMITKDPDLLTALQSRRLAVQKLDHEIIAGSDDTRMKEITEFVEESIERSRNWNEAIGHMLDAVPKGFSALWIEWKIEGNQVRFERLHYVPQKCFRFGKATDIKSDLHELRRITDDALTDGIELEPLKWIVHRSQPSSGYLTQTQLMRACTWMYLFKNFGWKAFVTYTEIFGLPLRLGKYPAGASKEDIDTLKKAVRQLGQDASGVFPTDMEIQIVEAVKAGGTDLIHVKLIELARQAYSRVILGHTGTSEATPGKLGSEEAAREVKFEITQADALALEYTITDQLIRPLVDFNFGPQEEYPYFKFLLTEPEDLLRTVQIDEKLVGLGLPLSRSYFYKKYGRPIPEDGDDLVEPRQQQTLPFGSGIAKGLLGGKADLLR